MTVRDELAEAILPGALGLARRDAETLLLHVLHRDRAWLLAHPEAGLTPTQAGAFHALAARRAAHEPLQYLTGTQEFYGLALRVTPATLIPRPETEQLVEAVLHHWVTQQTQPGQPLSPLRIADVGTGSGAIAIALATHLPTAQIVAIDLSAAALDLARENAHTHGCAHRITFLRNDLLEGLGPDAPGLPTFDIIVSNPPYVPLADAPTLAPEVRDHEPPTALFAGPDGLAIYRRLIPQAFGIPPHAALRSGGLLALEFGFGQRDALEALLTTTPPTWRNLRFLDDYANIPRIALAERP